MKSPRAQFPSSSSQGLMGPGPMGLRPCKPSQRWILWQSLILWLCGRALIQCVCGSGFILWVCGRGFILWVCGSAFLLWDFFFTLTQALAHLTRLLNPRFSTHPIQGRGPAGQSLPGQDPSSQPARIMQRPRMIFPAGTVILTHDTVWK